MGRNPRVLLPFIDVLFLMMMMIFFFVNPGKDTKTKPIADYSIIVQWTAGVDVDIDCYVLTPRGDVAYFNMKDLGDVAIDRDDLGTFAQEGNVNIEIINLRELADGPHSFSLHNYRTKDGREFSITAEITDRDGHTIASITVDNLPQGRELPVWTFIVKDHEIISIERSYTYVIPQRKR